MSCGFQFLQTMPQRITERRAWWVIGMCRAGREQTAIAHHLHLSQGTVSKLIHRYRAKHNVRSRVSTDRPKKTSVRDDRLLYRMCRQDRRFKSTRSLRDQWQKHINLRASCSTVNRRLLSRDLHSRRPAKKPLLTRERKTTRLEWARQHQHRRLHHWRHVLFSAESRYFLHRASGRVRVRSEADQRFQEDCALPSLAHSRGSLHVRGVIHYAGQTNLVILERNLTAATYRQLIETEMLPCANFLFQHDNAPAHRARRLQDFLQDAGFPAR